MLDLFYLINKVMDILEKHPKVELSQIKLEYKKPRYNLSHTLFRNIDI